MVDDQHEEGLLGWLDSPRLVVGAFAVFVLSLTVFAIFLWTDNIEQTDQLDRIVAQRIAEEEAAKREQVSNCYARANQGPALQNVLLVLESEVSPNAAQVLRDFRQLNNLNTPTIAECRQLAKHLNVPPRGG